MTQYTAVLTDPSTEDAVYIERGSGKIVEPFSVTIAYPFNVTREGNAIRRRPRFFRTTKTATAVNGNEITVGNLTGYETMQPSRFIGSSVRVHRITGGNYTEVGTDSIVSVDASIALTVSGGSYSADASGQIVNDTEFRFSIPGWHRPSHTKYLWVAAIDSNGDRSPWASAGSWTTPASITYSGPSNTMTASTLTGDENGALASPTGLSVSSEDSGQTCLVQWTAATGSPSGYMVVMTEDNSEPIARDDHSLTLSGSVSVQVNDLLIIDEEYDETFSRDDLFAATNWTLMGGGFGANGRGPLFEEDVTGLTWTFGEEDGIPHVSITNTSGSDYQLIRYTFGPPSQAWYTVPENGVDYSQTLEIKADAATTMTVDAASFTTPAQTINITTSWSTQTANLSISDNTTLNSGGSTSEIWIPNGRTVDIRSWITHDSRDHPLGWRADDLALLPAGTIVRTHSLIKTNPDSYDLERLTDPDMLPMLLANIKAANCFPWLQIEWHFGADEWDGFAEFLCTPYNPGTDTPASKPWAYKRYQQSQHFANYPATPWLAEFADWYLELGNENWNPLIGFYLMPPVSGTAYGASYAKLHDWAVGILRGHTDWDDSKWTYVLGGWAAGLAGWTNDVASNSSTGDIITIADYIGGWDTGQNTAYDPANPGDWRRIAGATPLDNRPAVAAALKEIADANGMDAGIYEGGPGYVLNGLNGGSVTPEQAVEQSEMMKSCAGWTATWCSTLTSSVRGYAMQNFFVFGSSEPQLWCSHSPGASGNKPNPPFMVQQFWMEHLLGGTVTELSKVKDPVMTNPDGDDVDALRVWKVAKDSKNFLIVANQDIDAPHDIKILAANIGGKFCTRHFLDTPNATPGEEYKAHNSTLATKDDVVLSSEAMLGNTSPLVATIPPGMTEIYEFS